MARCVCVWFFHLIPSKQRHWSGGILLEHGVGRQTAQTGLLSRFVEAMASEWYGRLCLCTVLRYFMIFLAVHWISNDFMIRINGKLGKLRRDKWKNSLPLWRAGEGVPPPELEEAPEGDEALEVLEIAGRGKKLEESLRKKGDAPFVEVQPFGSLAMLSFWMASAFHSYLVKVSRMSLDGGANSARREQQHVQIFETIWPTQHQSSYKAKRRNSNWVLDQHKWA